MAESPDSLTDGDVRVRLVAGRSILRLKSWLPAADVDMKLAGVELPVRVGATTRGELGALCTGPGDWLLVSSSGISGKVRERIKTEAVSQGLAVADLSSGLAVLEVSGTAARDVLAKSCGLDFDSWVIARLRCVRTLVAQVVVVIDAPEVGDALDLYVARSQGAWLNGWLADSAFEFRRAPRATTTAESY